MARSGGWNEWHSYERKNERQKKLQTHTSENQLKINGLVVNIKYEITCCLIPWHPSYPIPRWIHA